VRSRNPICAVGALFVCLALVGCATPSGLRGPLRAERPDVLIRPESGPEYDVLVAQQFEQQGRLADALAAYERAVEKDPDSAFLQRKVAESLVRQNRLADGIRHAERAHELEPDDLQTRIFLGQLYRLRRSPAAAEGLLIDEAGDPFDTDAGFLLFEVYMDSDRKDDALRVAKWLIDKDPEAVRSQLALASAYDALDQPKKSESVLRRALDEDPDNLALYVALARLRRERGDQAGEIAVYRQILDRSPGHHAALVALADAQLKAEDRKGATATLEEIEERHPDDLRTRVRLGFLYYEDRRYDDAIARFEQVLVRNPGEFEIVFFLGIAQRRSGHGDDAITTFDRIPASNEHYADARTQIAALYERRERFDDALAEVEKANAAKPSRELALYAATLRSKTGDFDGAVKQLEDLLAESPDDDELLYNLGVIYGEADDHEQAVAYMRRALDINSDNASALNYIGYTWAERGENLDEAEEMIGRALALRPEDGYIADSLGWVFYMRARPLVEGGNLPAARKYIDQALEALERADDLTGGDPVVSEHIGDTWLLLDEKQRALDRFEDALRMEPRFGEQPDLLEKLENLRRELQ
jgi:tetratricopeptide (TPR) repeat protein